MIYLPTMLILTLAASLIVAFIMNPVFAVSFMRPEGREYEKSKSAIFKKPLFWLLIAFGALLNLAGWHVASIGDFNGDSIDDVLWHSELGLVYEAFGATDGSGGFVIDFAGSINTGNSWRVQDPAVHDPLGALL